MRRSLSILFWFLFFFTLALLVGGVGAFEKWRQTPVTATLAAEALTGPREPTVIDFSQAIRPDSLAGKIIFQPAIPFQAEWQDFGKRLVIVPLENWSFDTTYQLSIGQGRTNWWVQMPSLSFSVAGPVFPRIVSVTPADRTQDVLLGVEDPIRIEFDRSVKDYYIDFQLEPKVEVVYQNNAEKTVFEILPTGELQSGTEYALRMRLRWRSESDEKYRSLGEIKFRTLPPKPSKLSLDFSTRISEAQRFTRAKETVGKYIDVNLSAQVMTLFEDGKALDAYMISSGKRGMDTPRGRYAIQNKAVRPWSKAYSLYMPYWQAITPDGKYGIHELPEWPGGYKEGANHLGTPVSHGCMRLGIGPAKRVYEWAPIGTPVVIY
jgi:hypothetical protein